MAGVSVVPQWCRVCLLPLHGSKMAVINPAGCGGRGHTLIPMGKTAVLTPQPSESQGDPPTTNKAVLSSPSWRHDCKPSVLFFIFFFFHFFLLNRRQPPNQLQFCGSNSVWEIPYVLFIFSRLQMRHIIWMNLPFCKLRSDPILTKM